MRAFSRLLDDLTYTRSRNAKLRLIGEYLRSAPDPDRGWALAALTGEMDIPSVKPSMIRALAEEKIDPVLYKISRDFVGDSAETLSLLWGPEGHDDVRLADAVEALQAASRSDAPAILAGLLDRLDASGLYALITLAIGALRVG
ncbi:MAG: ATP-dependent DNA ligase, partial [Sphingomonadaceae bacterium]